MSWNFLNSALSFRRVPARVKPYGLVHVNNRAVFFYLQLIVYGGSMRRTVELLFSGQPAMHC